MDLSLTEDQVMLQNTARDFMQRECSRETLLEIEDNELGYTDDMWQKASEIGWLGMATPEEYGGSGNSLTDTAVVFEQLGTGPLSGPFFTSGVLASFVVQECGTDDQKAELLPGIASGQEIATLALTEPDYNWNDSGVQMRAESKSGSLVLNGTKLFVHDAASATKILCVVRTDSGLSVVVVDANAPGVSTRLLPGFIGWVGEVKFESVEVPADSVLGTSGDSWIRIERAFQKAIPILSAYKVGASQAVFDMTIEYSRTREQFGQPIGRFQRVQDHVIDLVNHLDAARWTTYEALWKLDSGHDAETSVHLAKAVSSEGYFQACNSAHEVHAGVGVSREYGLTLHTRMSRTLYSYLGDPRFHRKKLAGTLDL